MTGGEGKIGKTLDIRGWENESDRSVACVVWQTGPTNVYRLGHKGEIYLFTLPGLFITFTSSSLPHGGGIFEQTSLSIDVPQFQFHIRFLYDSLSPPFSSGVTMGVCGVSPWGCVKGATPPMIIFWKNI